MSRQNKVNKTNYDQGGRLTPDDMARSRKQQADVSARGKERERITGKAGSRSAQTMADKSERASRGASRPRSAPEE